MKAKTKKRSRAFWISIVTLIAFSVIGVSAASAAYIASYSSSNAGLYNASGTQLATWNELVNTYDMGVAGYPAEAYNKAPDHPYQIFKNDDLDTGVKLVIDDSVTEIYGYWFRNCSKLQYIEIPDSVTKIGPGAFYNCSSIKSIEIPDSVTTIGGEAFLNCRFTSIEIPASVTSIGAGAFAWNSNLTTVTFAKGTKINTIAGFYNCTALSSIEIPASVTAIGTGAFQGCTGLSRVNIPDGVTVIGDWAFGNCTGLTSITIPAGVTAIGSDAFAYCENLSTINFKGTVAQWNAITKGVNWNYKTSATSVACSDGTVTVG